MFFIRAGATLKMALALVFLNEITNSVTIRKSHENLARRGVPNEINLYVKKGLVGTLMSLPKDRTNNFLL
jgi:hypothetical protein